MKNILNFINISKNTLNLYVENPDVYEYFKKDYQLKNKLKIKYIEHAKILPPKFFSDPQPWGRMKGGVIDDNGKFQAGLTRDKTQSTLCLEGYEIENVNCEISNETVFFGGIILPYFGHMFLETLSRMWGVISSNEMHRIVFLLEKNNINIPEYFWEFIKLLGIDKKRIIILQVPTIFSKVIIPDESFLLYYGWYTEYKTIIEKIKQNASDIKYNKVYLSRRNFKNDILNEEYFENFFQKQGFQILSIEQLPLSEQIGIWKNAKEVVCFAGTLPHCIVFSNPGVKLTILNRSKHPIYLQAFINQITQANVSFVDVYYNFLPTNHNCHKFITGPNKLFRDYVMNNHMMFSEEDFKFDISKFIPEYLSGWRKYYSEERFFSQIKNLTAQDFFKEINKYF